MMTEIFQASAQYNDWQGNAAADDDDNRAIRELLEERGLMTDDESLVGVEIFVGDNFGGNIANVYIHAYLVKALNSDDAQTALGNLGTIPKVKKVDVDNLSIEQFIGLFKRFSVALSWQNHNLIGRELDTSE